MRRRVMLFIIILLVGFLVTGCALEVIDESNIDQIINTVLHRDNKLSNKYFRGYKYYLPRGMKIINQKEYNAEILYNKEKYYLYVDVVSFYYDVKKEYKISSDSYYSDVLTDGDKYGYIEVNEINDKYFIEVMYNYSKMEAYVAKDNLSDAIVNMCMLLSSVEYNKNILDTIIGDKVLNYQEEIYDIFTSKRESGNFLDWVTEHEEEYSSSTSDEEKDAIESND